MSADMNILFAKQVVIRQPNFRLSNAAN